MATINGTGSDDQLLGTADSDIISGLAGNDFILDRLGGDDSLYGGTGNDTLRLFRDFPLTLANSVVLLDGGDGDDDLLAQSFTQTRTIAATLLGGSGNDTIGITGFVNAVVDAGAGNDIINFAAFADRNASITLGTGSDRIRLLPYRAELPFSTAWGVTDFVVGVGGDVLDLSSWLDLALTGWDQYNPFGGGFLQIVQSGADTLVQVDGDGGGNNWSTLFTLSNVTASLLTAQNFDGYGPDGSPAVGIVINGTVGDDQLIGGIGGDTIIGNGGRDFFAGNAGNDIILIGNTGSTAYGGAQDDRIEGGAGDDLLDGGAGNDIVSGGGGNDTFSDRDGGNDLLDGNDGDDTFNLLRADATGTPIANGGDGNDSFTTYGTGIGLVTLNGDAGDDRFTFVDSAGPYVITFGTGADSLVITSGQSRFLGIEFPREPFIPTITITDITPEDSLEFGDILEFGLTGWDGVTNPFATGHFRLVQDGAAAWLQIDRDGGANAFVDFIVFQNVLIENLTPANLGALPSDGSTPPPRTLIGTDGNDNLVGGAGSDTIILLGGEDIAIGGAGNDRIEGGGGFDTLSGGAGNDTLIGGDGDGLYGNAGNDLLIAEDGYVYLDGGSGNDMLDARNAGGATLIGGLGFDTIIGGLGADSITIIDADDVDGGANIDVASISFEGSDIGVTIDLRALWTGGTGVIGTGRISNVESITSVAGSAHDDIITLAGYSDRVGIVGGAGNDRIEGGNGDDSQLDGGTGDDTVIGNAGVDYMAGGDGNDSLFGGDDNDLLSGDAGNDVLDGGAGHDQFLAREPDGAPIGVERLYGGSGDDSYQVDGISDIVFENAGEGDDSVETYAGYYLWDNIESLYLGNREDGLNDFFGVGNSLDNILYGNSGANLLIAGAGNDEVIGNDGNDAIFGESGSDALNGGFGIDYIVGGSGNDTIDGGYDPDALYGEDGDDILISGGGFVTDILVGGNGDDILAGDSGYGFGRSGDGDYDLLDGGGGNDTYFVDTPDDLTFEALDGGIDTIHANINGAGYYLYANTENLVLEGRTPFGVGNELNNSITGNQDSNYLLGGQGNDTLNGKAGNDVLFGESGADTFVFERNTDGDVIGDFQVGVDKIQLTGLGFASFAQLQSAFVENAGTTAINLGQGDLIVINGVANAALSAGDFLFG